MVCLRIFRRHWICSTFVFSLFLLFSVFGLSHDSFATSVTCDLSSLDAYNINGPDFGDTYSRYCPGLFDSFSSSTSNIYLSYEISFTVINSSIPRNFSLSNKAVSDGYVRFYSIGVNSYGLSSGDYSYSGFISFVYSNRPNYIYWSFYRGDYSTGAYVTSCSITVSDDPPVSAPESCPVCPEIPENPYDNKFDALTKAIYCCGAILIMLYFFFCIYKIIVKDGGSR